MNSSGIIVLAAIVLAGCASQGAQAPAESSVAPTATFSVKAPQPGDEWTYRSSHSRQPGRLREQVVRVKSVMPERIVETISRPDGQQLVATHEPGAYVAGSNPGFFGFAPYLAAFGSVSQGDAWPAVPAKGAGPCARNPALECRFSARIAGAEKITVAAGTFETLRIEVEQSITGWGRVARPWTASRSAVFWYAPQAKRYVKMSWRTVAGRWRGPDGESELVSYKLN